MTLRQLKVGCYTLAALNTLATSYYLNYLFFFLRDHFGFGNRQNLWVSAMHGLLYAMAAWPCGKFAQRRGFFTSLKLGFSGLTVAMIAGALLNSVTGILCSLVGYTLVLLFTWPALEALVTAREPASRVPRLVGVYNTVWSGAAALAYFTGGKLYDMLGRGGVFCLPAAIFLGQYFLASWLSRQADSLPPAETKPAAPLRSHPEATGARQIVGPGTFLKLAWLANPFSYVAVNTLFAVMPALAQRLDLSPTKVGLFCSVWLFGRLAAFVMLWQWTGWHYRFRWLAGGFLVLIGSFLLILLASQLWMVVVGQVFFGLSTGLIYYSSLFYSMDVGEASAEHGGLHEGAIGLGIFAGTAVGAASLQFFPQIPNAGVMAVSVLLAAGWVALVAMWARARARAG